jgi:hypothetical protein
MEQTLRQLAELSAWVDQADKTIRAQVAAKGAPSRAAASVR